jgi:hypothetical protein
MKMSELRRNFFGMVMGNGISDGGPESETGYLIVITIK